MYIEEIIKKNIYTLLIVAFALMLTGCELFELKPLDINKKHTFKVLIIEDVNAPKFNYSEYSYLFNDRIPYLVSKYLEYDISLVLVERVSMKTFQRRYRHYEKEYADYIDENMFDVFATNKRPMIKSVYTSLGRYSKDVLAQYSGIPKSRTKAMDESDLKKFLYYKYIAGVKKVFGSTGISGDQIYNVQYAKMYSRAYWRVMARNISEYDILLVNFPIIAPEPMPDIESIARSGIWTGFVNPNFSAPKKGVIVWSIYPFVSSDSLFISERGVIPAKERKEVFAYYALHDFGHILNRYDEHLETSNCIMNPPRAFNHYSWYVNMLESDQTMPYKTVKQFY